MFVVAKDQLEQEVMPNNNTAQGLASVPADIPKTDNNGKIDVDAKNEEEGKDIGLKPEDSEKVCDDSSEVSEEVLDTPSGKLSLVADHDTVSQGDVSNAKLQCDEVMVSATNGVDRVVFQSLTVSEEQDKVAVEAHVKSESSADSPSEKSTCSNGVESSNIEGKNVELQVEDEARPDEVVEFDEGPVELEKAMNSVQEQWEDTSKGTMNELPNYGTSTEGSTNGLEEATVIPEADTQEVCFESKADTNSGPHGDLVDVHTVSEAKSKPSEQTVADECKPSQAAKLNNAKESDNDLVVALDDTSPGNDIEALNAFESTENAHSILSDVISDVASESASKYPVAISTGDSNNLAFDKPEDASDESPTNCIPEVCIETISETQIPGKLLEGSLLLTGPGEISESDPKGTVLDAVCT